MLALVNIEQEQDLLRLLNDSRFWYDDSALSISPIIHPQRWDLDDSELESISVQSDLHPLLASILAPRFPKICLETAVSCLHYLHCGGHSVRTRKSLKSLLKSSYFMRLKMRPCLSRFRKRKHRHPCGHCGLIEKDLCSEWWGNYKHRPRGCYFRHRRFNRIRVSLRFFSYRSQYAFNYDLWCTYRYALLLLPLFLANAPPDPQLASTATDCIFNSFCTAYPQETRKTKKSITRYLSRCRPTIAMPSDGRISVDSSMKDVVTSTTLERRAG